MTLRRSEEYYRERSLRFLELVDVILGMGEGELAGEVLWGAAAHAIKSAAQRRGWRHGSHGLLVVTVDRLIAEGGAPRYLSRQYQIASHFHSGFYGDREFTAGQIRRGKAAIAEFVQTLESLG